MPSCLGLIWFGTVVSVDTSSCSVKQGYKASPQSVAVVPLQLSGSTLHQGRWWQVVKKTWHGGVLTHSIPPMVLQPWLSSMSSHGNCSVCYPMASTGWRHLHPPPNTHDPVDIHFHYTLPEVFTHPLWTLQWMSMGEVITSHWSTPGKSCWPGAVWLPHHYPLMA